MPTNGIPQSGNLRRLLKMNALSEQTDVKTRNAYSDLSSEQQIEVRDEFIRDAKRCLAAAGVSTAGIVGSVALAPVTGGVSLISGAMLLAPAFLTGGGAYAAHGMAHDVDAGFVTYRESLPLADAFNAHTKDEFLQMIIAAYAEVSAKEPDLTWQAQTIREALGRRADELNLTPEAKTYATDMAQALFAGKRWAMATENMSDARRAGLKAKYDAALTGLKPSDAGDIRKLVEG